MSMVGNLVKVLAPAALLVASSSFAQILVPAEPVTIKNIKVNGTGCPLGTTAQNISDDKQAFTVTFSEFVAEYPGTGPASTRKNCIVTLNLKVPVGWQYSIGSFFYRGFMSLDEGIKATHKTQYSFEGQGKTGSFLTEKNGPLPSADFVYTDRLGIGTAIMPDTWSECAKDRALNINTSILVANTNATKYPNAQGLITNDSVDGEIKQVFGLTWRHCAL